MARPSGTVWRPGETDVSIRPGWFYHAPEDAKVKSVAELLQIHFASVGRNSKLLLNVPPGPNGLIADADRQRLLEFREAVDRIFRVDLASGAKVKWKNVGKRRAAEIDLGRSVTVGIAALEEAIESGQTVARYRLEGETAAGWQLLSRGETIGYRKLDRFSPVAVRRVRLVIEESLDTPKLAAVRLYAPSDVSF
jgi:alpha-L-fucosidase